ncbi:MAG TPA: MgtC/SapB family protein [Gemmatimonadaceae bacterium]|nr:MgtC/SapB family protein [Gemmatimonadaceae bacterium]
MSGKGLTPAAVRRTENPFVRMTGGLAIQSELEGAARLAVAGLIGLVVGLEREWSGHASGPDARFAGLRTFMMLGLLGGVAGLFAARGHGTVAAALVVGGAALTVSAYVTALRRSDSTIDGTTEAAALVVVALGALAGTGWLTLAGATGALMVLALSQKKKLHDLVRRIGETELHAALQFAVLAVVVLPLLPEGPFFGVLAIRPRALWGVVLAFLGLNFASYLARRAVGTSRGYGVAGALGGLMSSTAVTLTYARRSASQPALAAPLASGVIAACTVLIPRILVVSAVMNPAVALRAMPVLAPAAIAGVLFVVFVRPEREIPGDDVGDRNPLRFLMALEMAIAFQVALSLIAWVRPMFGELGVYGTAAALGLTDMDALTVSMSSRSSRIDPGVAGRALGVGVLANTLFKISLAAIVGRGAFRWKSALGLGVMAVVTTAAILWL